MTDLIAPIGADALEASGLDSDTVVLIRLAALDAISESCLMSLGAARQATSVTLD
ncbi:MAG TPA: hypothetical protein VMU39_14510 [Solirubrobacteraceae bacterium]|nr:hypothetical protein [Solirubrobacteraceae bacterium]